MAPPTLGAAHSSQPPQAQKHKKNKHKHSQQASIGAEWATEVDRFLTSVQEANASSDGIKSAWKRLHQSYAIKFASVVFPESSLAKPIDPFPFWAAENLELDILERVLRVEFANELANCNHMTMLQSTGRIAEISLWHLILYFGASVFSEHRMTTLRKRLRVFEVSPEDGSWPFTEAYKGMLRFAARKKGLPLKTTLIPCGGTEIVFKSPELSALASPNPEFDGEKWTTQAVVGLDKGLTGMPLSKKALFTKTSKQNTQLQGTNDDHGHDANHLPANGPGMTSPKVAAAEAKPFLRLDDARSGAFRAGSLDIPRPSIETINDFNQDQQQALRRPRISGVPQRGRQNISDPMVLERPPCMVKARNATGLALKSLQSSSLPPMVKREMSSDVEVIADPRRRKRSVDVEESRADEPKPDAKKQRVKNSPVEVPSSVNNWPRPQENVETRVNLLERGQDWDNETILTILKHLQAIRPNDFALVDGMGASDDCVLREPLNAEDRLKENILIPMKRDDGNRLLVVIRRNRNHNNHEYSSSGRKQGTIQYYDPLGGYESDDCRPCGKVARLIASILPDCSPDPEEWVTQDCVCPDATDGDTGVMICLVAICLVGSLPHAPPIPEETDWIFWRHIVLGALLAEDNAVQDRVRDYRADTVNRMVRQGEAPLSSHSYNGVFSSTTHAPNLGRTAKRHLERISQRANNSKRLLQLVHQGCQIFSEMVWHTDLASASFKTQLDKEILMRDNRQKSVHQQQQQQQQQHSRPSEGSAGSCVLREADSAVEATKLGLQRLGSAFDCTRRALNELSYWRKNINEALVQGDESVRALANS